MRWFAWNDQCKFHIAEVAALEMLLEHYFGPVCEGSRADNDPALSGYTISPNRELQDQFIYMSHVHECFFNHLQSLSVFTQSP